MQDYEDHKVNARLHNTLDDKHMCDLKALQLSISHLMRNSVQISQQVMMPSQTTSQVQKGSLKDFSHWRIKGKKAVQFWLNKRCKKCNSLSTANKNFCFVKSEPELYRRKDQNEKSKFPSLDA
jgi:hypothetical protein